MTNNIQFKELMESVNSGIIVLQDEEVVYINDLAADGLGQPISKIIGTNLTKYLSKDSISTFNNLFPKVKQGTPKEIEIKLTTKSGKALNILRTAQPLFDANGVVVSILLLNTDPTKRKPTGKEFDESENKFRSILENIHLFAVMLDSKANISFANKHLIKKTGWKVKELLGKNYFDVFVSKEKRIRSKKRFKEIISSKQLFTNRTNEMFTKNGKRLIIDWNVTAQYDDNGKLINATSIGTDITERLQAESDLRFQSE